MLVLALSLGGSTIVHAQTTEPIPTTTPKPYFAQADKSSEAETDYEDVDAVHDTSMSTLFNLTKDIDDFFGDVRGDEQRQNDWYRIGAETRIRSSDGVHVRERLRASIDLSAYAKNLRFFIDGESGSKVDRVRPVNDQLNAPDFDTSYLGDAATSGVKYDLYKTNDSLISATAGAKFSGGPHPFTDLHFSKWLPITDVFSFEPTQYFQWVEGDGFGVRSRFDLNYRLGLQSRVRARTEVLRSENSRGAETLEDISYLFKFCERRYAGFGVTGTYYSQPAWTAEDYRLSARYRQLIYKNYLYLELEPALEFPNDRDYRATPSITFRLDMYLEHDSHVPADN